MVSSGLLGGSLVCLVGPGAGVVPVRETVRQDDPYIRHLVIYRNHSYYHLSNGSDYLV